MSPATAKNMTEKEILQEARPRRLASTAPPPSDIQISHSSEQGQQRLMQHQYSKEYGTTIRTIWNSAIHSVKMHKQTLSVTKSSKLLVMMQMAK